MLEFGTQSIYVSPCICISFLCGCKGRKGAQRFDSIPSTANIQKLQCLSHCVTVLPRSHEEEVAQIMKDITSENMEVPSDSIPVDLCCLLFGIFIGRLKEQT